MNITMLRVGRAGTLKLMCWRRERENQFYHKVWYSEERLSHGDRIQIVGSSSGSLGYSYDFMGWQYSTWTQRSWETCAKDTLDLLLQCTIRRRFHTMELHLGGARYFYWEDDTVRNFFWWGIYYVWLLDHTLISLYLPYFQESSRY